MARWISLLMKIESIQKTTMIPMNCAARIATRIPPSWEVNHALKARMRELKSFTVVLMPWTAAMYFRASAASPPFSS